MRSRVLVLLFAGLLTACGTTTVGSPTADQHQADDLCNESLAAVDQMARENPSMPADQIRATIKRNCRHPVVASAPAAVAAASSHGCAAPDDVKAMPIRHTAQRPPSRPVPFFAPRAGSLPRDGTPLIGGIQLPAGSRCRHQWATDAPVPNAKALAAQLAAVFPVTGLWPVIWANEEDPDTYAETGSDPARADRVDVEKVLRRLWSGFTPQTSLPPFPGLASGSPGIGTSAGDPFGAAIESDSATPLSDGNVLVLVPANRPADVIATMGPISSRLISDADATAVVRSWEERFGAVVTSAGPGELGLSIEAPPRGGRQEVEAAAETEAFAPDASTQLDQVIAALKSGSPLRTGFRDRRTWFFGWPD